MEWISPFIVYRITGDGLLQEVFHAADLKKAKYWLTYIAQPGDVLCKTPLHPKHTQKSKQPEYWGHKAQSGTPSSLEDDWKKFAAQKAAQISWPEEQIKSPESES